MAPQPSKKVKSWTEVACGIDRVSGVGQRQTDRDDHQTDEKRGLRFDIGAVLRVSMSAQISSSRIPVPTIWSSKGPHQESPRQFRWGNVAKIE
ncbi:hypothetical protein SHIRM173S_07168 [Streptomyces hirsutus]